MTAGARDQGKRKSEYGRRLFKRVRLKPCPFGAANVHGFDSKCNCRGASPVRLGPLAVQRLRALPQIA